MRIIENIKVIKSARILNTLKTTVLKTSPNVKGTLKFHIFPKRSDASRKGVFKNDFFHHLSEEKLRDT
jgi:hypothetical protein